MKKYTTVNEFLDALDLQQNKQVTVLRAIIMDTFPELHEHVKWNSPSYTLNGEDRVTFSVRPGFPISIVLHMGVTRAEDKSAKPIMSDSTGLIEWKSDTRGIVSFSDLNDIQVKKSQFVEALRNWLSII